MVRLLDEEFVACLVNNRGDAGAADAGGPGGGENDTTLAQFGEARLANPVVRFVDRAGAELAPRLDSQWDEQRQDYVGPSVAAVLGGASAALAAMGKSLPPWAAEAQAALPQQRAEL